MAGTSEERAGVLLDRAEECRQIAAMLNEEVAVAAYLTMAETYEALAAQERLLNELGRSN